MALSRSKFPATVVDPRLRVKDPRWPEGPKPAAIIWGNDDGKIATRLNLRVPGNGDPVLRIEALQTQERSLPFGIKKIWKWEISDKQYRVVRENPTNMGITSRLTDLYDAVRQLDLSGVPKQRLAADYRPQPNQFAIRLDGERSYYVFDKPAQDAKSGAAPAEHPGLQAVKDATESALIAIATGE